MATTCGLLRLSVPFSASPLMQWMHERKACGRKARKWLNASQKSSFVRRGSISLRTTGCTRRNSELLMRRNVCSIRAQSFRETAISICSLIVKNLVDVFLVVSSHADDYRPCFAGQMCGRETVVSPSAISICVSGFSLSVIHVVNQCGGFCTVIACVDRDFRAGINSNFCKKFNSKCNLTPISARNETDYLVSENLRLTPKSAVTVG